MKRLPHTHTIARELTRDLAIVFFSILLTGILVQSGTLERILAATGGRSGTSSFIAGTLYTSIFTIAPAAAALVTLAETNPVWAVAAWGALGAVLGDLLIFRFVKDSLSRHILARLHASGFTHSRSTKSKLARLALTAVGAIILAAPLPDEIGVALMGLSHVKQEWFVGISYACNFIGIMAIGIIVKNVA